MTRTKKTTFGPRETQRSEHNLLKMGMSNSRQQHLIQLNDKSCLRFKKTANQIEKFPIVKAV